MILQLFSFLHCYVLWVIKLLSNLVIKLGSFYEDKSDESKILVIYRFVSLIITATFYLFDETDSQLLRRFIIIGCLLISSLILSYLYPLCEKSHKNIKLLIIVETIGNVLLIIPSGGIKSPFIWYSLNTILVSFIFLEKAYGWINFLIYLLSYGIIIKYFTDTNEYLRVIKDESNLLLSFIMIVVAIQVLAISLKRTKEEGKRFEEANIKLEVTNQMLFESIEHIKELYQSVNILTNHGNKEGILKLSFEQIKKITKTKLVFYYDIASTEIMISSENNYLLKSIKEHILKGGNGLLESKIPLEAVISDTKFLIIHVKGNYNTYGLLGMELNDKTESSIYVNNAYQLQFISELISNAFERLTFEEVNERLSVTEEQNRIANEIHDSVMQKLFSISCSMFSLIKGLNEYTADEIKDELNLFRTIIDSTMKELRSKIYGLSWKKSGRNSFSRDIKRYIDDIKKLNHVNIPFSIHGNIETLTIEQKKALYRMICESISNAVRHGEAKNIEIKLEITSEHTNLNIADDGMGFNYQKVVENTTKGLGLQNLHQLTENLHGKIKLESELQSGTKIEIMLPNRMLKGEAIV